MDYDNMLDIAQSLYSKALIAITEANKQKNTKGCVCLKWKS